MCQVLHETRLTLLQASSQTSTSKPLSRMDRGPVAPSKKQEQLGLNIYGARPSSAAAPSVHAAGTALPSGSARASGKSPAKPQQQLLRPIIIVPKGDTAMINMLNAPKLFRVRSSEMTHRHPVLSSSLCKCNSFRLGQAQTTGATRI